MPDEKQTFLVLTEAEKKSRRSRNIALALILGGLVVLFYVVTLVKFGENILLRAAQGG